MHNRSGDEDAAFERVMGHAVAQPRHRRYEIVLRRDGLASGVEQQEAAGAVGVLGEPRFETGLAEEGRLLIAGDARDRHAGAQHVRFSANAG